MSQGREQADRGPTKRTDDVEAHGSSPPTTRARAEGDDEVEASRHIAEPTSPKRELATRKRHFNRKEPGHTGPFSWSGLAEQPLERREQVEPGSAPVLVALLEQRRDPRQRLRARRRPRAPRGRGGARCSRSTAIAAWLPNRPSRSISARVNCDCSADRAPRGRRALCSSREQRDRHQALRHEARRLGRLAREARVRRQVLDHDRLRVTSTQPATPVSAGKRLPIKRPRLPRRRPPRTRARRSPRRAGRRTPPWP